MFQSETDLRISWHKILMAEMSQNPERILTHLHHGILTHGVDESKSGDAGSEDARGCRVEFEIKAQVRAFRVDERVSKGRHGRKR